MRAIIVAVMLTIGCAEAAEAAPPPPSSQPAPAPSPPPPSQVVYGRYYVAAGAPDPLWCTTDKECIGDTITEFGGCCIAGPTAWPQTWAYHTWISARRQSAICRNIKCKPLPAPVPAQCWFDVHCVAEKCQNSCKSM